MERLPWRIGAVRVSQESLEGRDVEADGDEEAPPCLKYESRNTPAEPPPAHLFREPNQLDRWTEQGVLTVNHCLEFEDKSMFEKYSSKGACCEFL